MLQEVDKDVVYHIVPTELLESASDSPRMGQGKCMVGGCSCPSYVDPPGGFDCKRCGHPFSEHW